MISNRVSGVLSSCKQMLNTVTVNEQFELLPDVSVAVHRTVVVPSGNVDPEGGTHAVVTPGQLSVATGLGYVTVRLVAIGHDAAATLVRLRGHVMAGDCVSLIVTAKEQLAGLPLASLTEHTTVVIPFGKAPPDAGVQVTVPTPGQLSLAEGVG